MENKLFIETPFGDLIAYESITAFMRGNCGGEFTIEAYQGGKDRITLATLSPKLIEMQLLELWQLKSKSTFIKFMMKLRASFTLI